MLKETGKHGGKVIELNVSEQHAVEQDILKSSDQTVPNFGGALYTTQFHS
ncbi:hypothetical protein PAXRUDRAFT_21648 [Paxillus rubicundulus Ve08.2h10]|uniref:Uncharacterized protein n=1 Tax=Paxillus rubicundulus Ve08.2h10 TaxID=930991 RepID=A0A0D0CPI8_9AGAM|nr:hypothetical protein PAXRUDRAFT_21648 [Paxillus rubicundulus Ve08.2h10]